MTVHSRHEWGALAPIGARLSTRGLSGITTLYIHYADLVVRPVLDDELRAVRGIQSFHMNAPDRKYGDIAYTELIGLSGEVYAGRDIKYIPAATEGHNTNSIAFCVLTNDDFTEGVVNGILERRAFYEEKLGRKLTVAPHSAAVATHCPGDKLRAWIRAGLPKVGVPIQVPPAGQIGAPGSSGGTVGGGNQGPTPPQSTNSGKNGENEMQTPPMIKEGDRGKYVANAQGLLWTHGLGGVLGDSPDHAMDGQFGSRTSTAVRQFQSSRGLVVDGVVGPLTWGNLLDVSTP